MKAIKVVCAGEMWVERKLVTRAFQGGYIKNPDKENSPENTNGILTPREKEVLLHLTQGSSNKEIANQLFISEKTVKSHLNAIFKKLNVSRRLEAVLYAIKSGLS